LITFFDTSSYSINHTPLHSHSFETFPLLYRTPIPINTMKISAAVIFASIASFVVAQKPDIDTTILNYALTLEHLEANFYAGVLQKFNKKAFTKAGYSVAVYQRVQELARQEAVHVATLESVLGAAATKPCEYAFPYKTVDQALALSRVLESVGVSAYLGAAPLITSDFYLTAAGSILSVEARHQAVIAEINGGIGFPSAFDTPLGFSQVYSLAAPFIKYCPSTNPALPVTRFPELAIVGGVGRTIQLQFECELGSTPLYAHVLSGLEPYVVKMKKNHSFITPPVRGTIYIVVSTSSEAAGLTDANTVAGPVIAEVPNNFAPLFVKARKH